MDKNNFLIKGFLESPNHPSLKVRMDNAESEFIDFKNDLLSDVEDHTVFDNQENFTAFDWLDIRLKEEGIIGYTEDIMRWVIQVIGLGLEDHELRKLGL